MKPRQKVHALLLISKILLYFSILALNIIGCIKNPKKNEKIWFCSKILTLKQIIINNMKNTLPLEEINITNGREYILNLNGKAQKPEENLNNKSKFTMPEKIKNIYGVKFNNNNGIQNKLISDNINSKEPDDIKDYNNLPLNEIKNNCNPRGYEWKLMPEKISPNQLKQETENCYMVSALEEMSHIPFLLKYIYEDNFCSNQDSFKLSFRQKNGNIEHYIVLNNFPVKEKELIYIKPLENEAYAIIFEKVWAVIRGGYKNMKSGKSHEVFDKVLGTTTKYLHNDNMKKCELDPEKYIQSKSQSNISDKDIEDIEEEIQKTKESDIKMINKINKIKNNDKKIESKKAFDEIREAEKEGGITTVSLNMKDGGHCYSVLGTYSKKNDKTGKIQDFIILKNPWRSGDDLKEKINISKIEEQLDGLDKIKEINRNHYETGIFYMPKEYFEGWFRSICICKPKYKEYFPKVYDTLNLYKDIYEYYNIDADKTFFESFHGNELIKTNIISKENLKVLLKIVHHIKSDFNIVFEDEKLSTIWYEKNKTKISTKCLDKNKDLEPSADDKKIDLKFPTDYYFIMKNNTLIVELKEQKDIKDSDFNNAKVYSVGIAFYKNRWNIIYPKGDKIPSKKKTESKNLLVNLLKNDFDYMPLFDYEQEGFLNYSSINLIMNQLKNALSYIQKSKDEVNGILTSNPNSLINRKIYKDLIDYKKKINEINGNYIINLTDDKKYKDLTLKSKDEINGLLTSNPNSLINGKIYKDLTSNQKSHIDIEIKKESKDKYKFIKRAETGNSKTTWVTIFNGINLYSNEVEDGHYHVCSYGQTNTANLFNLIGQKFKCKCYYIVNNIKIKECNKYFIFQKRILFYNYTYKINDIPITCNHPYYDEYDLEKEKNKYDSIK